MTLFKKYLKFTTLETLDLADNLILCIILLLMDSFYFTFQARLFTVPCKNMQALGFTFCHCATTNFKTFYWDLL